MSPRLRHGSLFAGYGGLDLAVADVFGAETAWVSDVDKGACRILEHRYPDAPNLGDITAVDWADVEPVDIISGGSPCQDLSHAGRRAGMKTGTRSGLWESMREAVAILRPAYVIWENVHGAMSATASSALEHCPGCMGDPRHRGPVLRALGRVLGDLADLGYDAQWHGLRVSDLGGCHGRFRVFVLAYANEQRHERRWRARDGGPRPTHSSGEALTLLPTPSAIVANDREGPGTWLARRERVKLAASNGNGMGMPLTIAVQLLPTPTTTQRGTDANLDTREGARANLHNEVAKLLPTPTTAPTTGNGHARNLGGEVRMLPTPLVGSTSPASHGQISGQWRDAMADALSRWGDYAEAIARHERLTGRPAPDPTEPGPKGNPRLSARFVEFMMALPPGWVTDVPGITRNQALKALGNGVVPPQAAHALRLMMARAAA